MADVSFRDRLQMFTKRVDRPTGLILRGVECWPRCLNEVNEASLKPKCFLVVALERGSCLKFGAPGTDEFDEAIHRIRPVA